MKSLVGYSVNKDSFMCGIETCQGATKNLENAKIGFLYTSENNNIKQVVKGVQSACKMPLIGCTSSNGIIVPEGVITSPEGYAGMLVLDDEKLTIGLACHEAGNNPRVIGRKVAIQAVENAKTTRAPAYFYMVASPKEEEEYLMGIQDVIGRVPMFGGSAADDNVEGNWKIMCHDKVINDGVAVAFFYTDNEINTCFTGAYRETENIGLITEVEEERTLVSIDNMSALKKYAHWTNNNTKDLIGKKLLQASVTKPLGVKDPLGNLMVIRQPMFGDDMGTKSTIDDAIRLGNKVVKGTAIVQLEATEKELITATSETLIRLRNKMFNQPIAYILIHCAGRRIGLGDKIEEVYHQVLKEAKGVPFIMPFTFGEYGYEEHSSNICGGLMLSFTAIGKK